jgi:hypothetical protein
VWPNLFLIFDCPSSAYTDHDHDLFRTLSKWISVDIKIIGQVCLRVPSWKNHIFRFCAFWGSLSKEFFFFKHYLFSIYIYDWIKGIWERWRKKRQISK